MAQRKVSLKKQKEIAMRHGAVGGLVGALPIAGSVQAYRGARHAGAGKALSAGAGILGSVGGPIGAIGGAYAGYEHTMHGSIKHHTNQLRQVKPRHI